MDPPFAHFAYLDPLMAHIRELADDISYSELHASVTGTFPHVLSMHHSTETNQEISDRVVHLLFKDESSARAALSTRILLKDQRYDIHRGPYCGMFEFFKGLHAVQTLPQAGIKDRSRRGSDASATSARSGFGRRIWEALPLRKRTSSQSTVDMSRAATPSSRSSSRMSVEREGTTDLDATITQKPQSAMRKCSEVKGRQESRVHENLLPGSTISSAVSLPPSPSCQSKLVERLPTAAPEAYKISDTGTMVKVPQEGLRPEIDIAMFEGINPQQSAKKILTLPAPEPKNESPKSLPAPSPPNATDLPPRSKSPTSNVPRRESLRQRIVSQPPKLAIIPATPSPTATFQARSPANRSSTAKPPINPRGTPTESPRRKRVSSTSPPLTVNQKKFLRNANKVESGVGSSKQSASPPSEPRRQAKFPSIEATIEEEADGARSSHGRDNATTSTHRPVPQIPLTPSPRVTTSRPLTASPMSNAGSEADSRASSRKLVQRMTYPPPAETALQNTTARNRLVSTATEAPNGRQRAAATISTPIAMPSKRAPTLSLKPTAGSQPLNPRPLGPRDRVSSQSQNPRSRFQTLLIGPKSPTQPLTPRSLTARR